MFNSTTDPYSHGLIESKIWLAEKLESLKLTNFDNIYLLGGWAGLVGFILYVRGKTTFKKLINIDIDSEAIKQSRHVLDVVRCQSKLECFVCDAMNVKYDVGNNLIINTSADNMNTNTWLDIIPQGSTVVIQSRTGNHVDNYYPVKSLDHFNSLYNLDKAVYLGQKVFDYPENSYTRFMKIGFK